MPRRPAKTAENVADSVADSLKSAISRLVDAEVTNQIARSGKDIAALIAERGAEVSERANEAWRDTRPMRRDAAKAVAGATEDAAKWSESFWRRSLRPALKDLWKQRTVAIGAAGAAVPAGRELIDTAAVRLGMKERERQQEQRRWGAFFMGMLLGAAAGAVAALLTTPKRGSEVRRELGERADVMRRELGERADEIAARAREAEWMPVFQREPESGNGHATSTGTSTSGSTPTTSNPSASRTRGSASGGSSSGSSSTPRVSASRPSSSGASSSSSAKSTKRRASGTDAENVQAGATEAGATGASPASGAAADRAANDTAEAINEAYDVDREATDRAT